MGHQSGLHNEWCKVNNIGSLSCIFKVQFVTLSQMSGEVHNYSTDEKDFVKTQLLSKYFLFHFCPSESYIKLLLSTKDLEKEKKKPWKNVSPK